MADLTAFTGAPAAFPYTERTVSGFDSPQFGSKQYGYIDGQYHLDEVSYWSGSWHTTDLTARANANADGQAEDVLGFASPQFGSRQYGYIDTWTRDFEETYFVAGTWYTVDLTQIAHP